VQLALERRTSGISLTTNGSAAQTRGNGYKESTKLEIPLVSTPSIAHSSLSVVQTDEKEEERLPLRGLRRQIAQNMLRSVQTIPQVTSLLEVDASKLVALRNTLQPEAEQQGVKLSYIPFIARALVQALRQYPYVNAVLDEQRNEIVLKHAYHLGIATATPDGLLVPVIRHVDRLTLLEIAREIKRLSELAHERKLAPHELKGSTFTLTNYGSVGGFFTTPLINPGEAAILGAGKIVKRPWVVDDHLEVRPVLPLSFTADHRLIDGELAMRFLNTLVALLEEPTRMMLTMR
jgi:pyruvate dehydrogenase E2 component (dihydrolipoamide acetyltransferase)